MVVALKGGRNGMLTELKVLARILDVKLLQNNRKYGKK